LILVRATRSSNDAPPGVIGTLGLGVLGAPLALEAQRTAKVR
jgi:hypothetical protein